MVFSFALRSVLVHEPCSTLAPSVPQASSSAGEESARALIPAPRRRLRHENPRPDRISASSRRVICSDGGMDAIYPLLGLVRTGSCRIGSDGVTRSGLGQVIPCIHRRYTTESSVGGCWTGRGVPVSIGRVTKKQPRAAL